MPAKKKLEEVDNRDAMPEPVVEDSGSEDVKDELTTEDLSVRADKLERNLAKIIISLMERVEALEIKVNYLDRYNPSRG